MSENVQKFKEWCLVELMGHQRIAGLCTEQNVAGTNLLRVDVPNTESQPAFTKFFNHSALYAITPIDEKTAIVIANEIKAGVIATWSAEEFFGKYLQHKSLPSSHIDHFEDLFYERNL
jgi:hypothetical protein